MTIFHNGFRSSQASILAERPRHSPADSRLTSFQREMLAYVEEHSDDGWIAVAGGRFWREDFRRDPSLAERCWWIVQP